MGCLPHLGAHWGHSGTGGTPLTSGHYAAMPNGGAAHEARRIKLGRSASLRKSFRLGCSIRYIKTLTANSPSVCADSWTDVRGTSHAASMAMLSIPIIDRSCGTSNPASRARLSGANGHNVVKRQNGSRTRIVLQKFRHGSVAGFDILAYAHKRGVGKRG